MPQDCFQESGQKWTIQVDGLWSKWSVQRVGNEGSFKGTVVQKWTILIHIGRWFSWGATKGLNRQLLVQWPSNLIQCEERLSKDGPFLTVQFGPKGRSVWLKTVHFWETIHFHPLDRQLYTFLGNIEKHSRYHANVSWPNGQAKNFRFSSYVKNEPIRWSCDSFTW